MEKKQQTELSDLCKGFPRQFQDYLCYARRLGFIARPDYTMLHDLIHQCREPDWEDHSFQWFEGKELSSSSIDLIPRSAAGFSQPDDRVANMSSNRCFYCLCGKERLVAS